MDFTLDQKHEMARDLFKQFAETEVKPLAQETDETEVFPAETVAKMGKYGFMGIPVPKEYGGQKEPHEYPALSLAKTDRKSTRLNSSHPLSSRMPSSA